jgi:peptidoglycan/LPS O-acetylase OafA/YrhL
MATYPRDNFTAFARGFSILTIVLFHYYRLVPLPYLVSKAVLLGGTGVHVFLFLSGFGLSLSKFATWGGFFKKRFVKVLVPYYFGMLLIFGINLLLHVYPDGLRELLSHLFLYKMFVENYTRSFGGHFWFISTIVQFYLLFPVIIKAYERLGARRALLLSVLISLTYSLFIIYLGKSDQRIWNSFFLQYLWEFTLGIVVARQKLLPRLLNYKWYYYVILCVGGIAGTALLAIFGGQPGRIFNDYFAFTGYVCGSVLIFRIGARLAQFFQAVFWVESISYALYIMHMLPLSTYMALNDRKTLTLLEVPPLLVAAVAVAILFDIGMKRILNSPVLRMVQS